MPSSSTLDRIRQQAKGVDNRRRPPPTPSPEEDDFESVILPRAEERVLPPLSLLTQADPEASVPFDPKPIPGILRQFKIASEVAEVISGPRLTRALIRPLKLQPLSRISRLESELAFSLKVPNVRVVPLNELGLIAIEIPHREFNPTRLVTMFEARADQGPLTIPIGATIEGDPLWVSLADAPHMLVAGTTGSGKSMFLNQTIISLALQYRPNQLRMLLVDLKRGVEFGPYESLPHVNSIAYTPEEAMSQLGRMNEEMEARYSRLQDEGARNISEFEGGMPYVAVVIDELAALVEDYPDVQEQIISLAQLGRAAGIHLLLATQHPSRDVLKGRLKANVASCIAFATSSRIDSQVIIGHGGAERLLGKGDAILRFVGSDEERVSTCLIDANEITNVVGWWVNN